MDAPTLELKPLKEENGVIADDRSNSPYPATPTPLPPYSDMDHNFVVSESKGYSGEGNAIDSENNSGGETRDASIRTTNDRTVRALSAFYAQVVFVAASVLVLSEVLHGPIPLLFFHGYVFTYLVGGSILIFLGTYIIVLLRKCPQFTNGEYDAPNPKSHERGSPFIKNLFNSDVSFYLRIGAVVFGSMTFASCAMEIASLFSVSSGCMDNLNSTQTVLRALFSFLQMPFLFMNSKKIIHSLGCFKHVTLMHLIATNLSMWIRLVLWESAKDWLDATHVKHNASSMWPSKEFSVTVHTLESDVKSSNVPTHNIHYTTNCYWRDAEEMVKTEDLIALQLCLQNSTVGTMWKQAMPYFYPFMVQYGLVAAAIIYIISSTFHSSHSKLKQVTTVSVNAEDSKRRRTKCSDSSKGLFFGFIVMTAGIVSLILFFVVAEDSDFSKHLLITILRCAIFGTATLAAVIGIAQIKKMKAKTKRRYRLTELLQNIGKFILYIFGICCMVVGGVSITKTQHLLLFLDGMLMIIQAFLQSLFIHQISKKRLGPSNLNDKPGRHAVIFLAFSNMALWLLESFTTQDQESITLQLQFFGPFAWSLISRVLMPLVIFYRFHSAAALMDAWKKSYKVKQN